MILVLDATTSQELVQDLCRELESLGGQCQVSSTDDQVVIAVSGIDEASLETVLDRRGKSHGVRLLGSPGRWVARSRRWFVNGLIAGFSVLTGAVLAIPVIAFLVPPRKQLAQPDRVRVASVADIADNSAKVVRFRGHPVVLVREADRYFALSAVCTHMDVCQVDWDPNRRLLVCPCHGGAFDLHGNVVQGPPPRPLASLDVKLQGEHIFIQREV